MLILQETAYSSAPSLAKGANGFASRPSVSASSGGTGGNSTPAVQVLRVLAEDDEVDAFLVVQRIARVRLAGAQADVEVEELPHADDRRAVDETLAPQIGHELGLGGLDRLRGDRAEHRGVDALQAGRSCAGGRHRPRRTRTPSRCRRRGTRRPTPGHRARCAPRPSPRRRCRLLAARRSGTCSSVQASMAHDLPRSRPGRAYEQEPCQIYVQITRASQAPSQTRSGTSFDRFPTAGPHPISSGSTSATRTPGLSTVTIACASVAASGRRVSRW